MNLSFTFPYALTNSQNKMDTIISITDFFSLLLKLKVFYRKSILYSIKQGQALGSVLSLASECFWYHLSFTVLESLLKVSKLQFSHLYNGDNNSTYLLDSSFQLRLKDQIHVHCLEEELKCCISFQFMSLFKEIKINNKAINNSFVLLYSGKKWHNSFLSHFL